MLAMTLSGLGQPLVMADLSVPEPGEHDIRIKVLACGVCRTDLHIIDGDLPPRIPGIVPGHEVVGRVVAAGRLATRFQMGDRIGIPWRGGACGDGWERVIVVSGLRLKMKVDSKKERDL